IPRARAVARGTARRASGGCSIAGTRVPTPEKLRHWRILPLDFSSPCWGRIAFRGLRQSPPIGGRGAIDLMSISTPFHTLIMRITRRHFDAPIFECLPDSRLTVVPGIQFYARPVRRDSWSGIDICVPGLGQMGGSLQG